MLKPHLFSRAYVMQRSKIGYENFGQQIPACGTSYHLVELNTVQAFCIGATTRKWLRCRIADPSF